MKQLKTIYLFAIATVTMMYGCSAEKMEDLLRPLVKAPGSTIERNVKGHEQIYSVQAMLRLALKSQDRQSYVAYELSNAVEPPVPIFQQIDMSKDDEGRITITSGRKNFDVVKSKYYYYALELRYYDLNGKLINHQFSTFDKDDSDGSTLLHHQHFFTLQNYSLTGEQLVYPMTLDSLYYDAFTFKGNGKGERVESTIVSPNNVYVQTDGEAADKVKYEKELAQAAVERSTTKKAQEVFIHPKTGKRYKLYKALNSKDLDEKVRDIFQYVYRDTDPVEEYLGNYVKGVDDLGRQRIGKPVQLLQQKRDLNTKAKQDYLGFKGILNFNMSDVTFQMRICIAHMITDTEKYINGSNVKGKLHEHDEISPAWNSYDIDYPLAFRIMGDADGDPAAFVEDVRRIYPEADGERLLQMFGKDPEWFRRIPTVIF